MAREAVPLKSVSEILLRVEMYLCKSYYKTASFIRYMYRSIALLGGHAYASATAAAMEELGFHLGPAYQIQDDILDFKADASIRGSLRSRIWTCGQAPSSFYKTFTTNPKGNLKEVYAPDVRIA